MDFMHKDTIDAFLAKHKPSSGEVPGPWLWVRLPHADDTEGKAGEELGEEDDTYVKLTKEGQPLVDKMMARLDEIKETAPVRANKSKGLRSQKDLREETYEQFKADVKELAQKHHVLSGKWLFYPQSENVDFTWSKLVRAIADKDGALAKTGHVHTAKVATTPKIEGERSSFVVCVYCDDSYDEDAVGDVFKVLVKDLSMTSQSFKPDVLTLLGIDSQHPSKLPVSLYKKTTFMTQDELNAQYEASSKAKKAKDKTLDEEVAAGAADGFDPVSESEDEQPRKKKVKTKK